VNWTEQQLADYLERTGVPGQPNRASTSAPPFAVCSDIILDLPAPPSVNRTRKIDWSARDVVRAWSNVANAYVLAAKGRAISPLQLTKISRFELLIVLSAHHTKIDLDNSLKSLIDYLRHIGVIEDDGPKHMRKLTVEWGLAPHGCRVTVRPCE
jgi:Holliday junction resolvase RusA-like endonuclease